MKTTEVAQKVGYDGGKLVYDDLDLDPDLDTPLQEVDRALSSDGELL